MGKSTNSDDQYQWISVTGGYVSTNDMSVGERRMYEVGEITKHVKISLEGTMHYDSRQGRCKNCETLQHTVFENLAAAQEACSENPTCDGLTVTNSNIYT